MAFVDTRVHPLADGSTGTLWSQDEDTRTQKIMGTELFKDVKVRGINPGNMSR